MKQERRYEIEDVSRVLKNEGGELLPLSGYLDKDNAMSWGTNDGVAWVGIPVAAVQAAVLALTEGDELKKQVDSLGKLGIDQWHRILGLTTELDSFRTSVGSDVYDASTFYGKMYKKTPSNWVQYMEFADAYAYYRSVVSGETAKLLDDVRLAEHKIDQYLQGQGPGTVRLGVALQACRRAILQLEQFPPKPIEREG